MIKKTLVGSIFVLTILLLTPSIPAIQQKTIEDKAYNDFYNELQDLNFKDVELLDGEMTFPLLFVIVYFIARNRVNRALRILKFAIPEYYILAIYGFWLFESYTFWMDFWIFISKGAGWNWNLHW